MFSASFSDSKLPDSADGHSMRVYSVKFHPHNDNVLISGGWDDTLQVSLLQSLCQFYFKNIARNEC